MKDIYPELMTRIARGTVAVTLATGPVVALAQAATSPFLTGATALQTNILAWLTPIAIILVMALGAMAMAARLSWGWCIGAILGIAIAFGAPQIVVENCGNTLILRCAGSEHGGTAQFASRLIGEREVLRRQTSRGRDREGWLVGRGLRRSMNVSEQRITEFAVMPSELEQLPDLTGYLKTASSGVWLRVGFSP
jgi:type IV secretory pathway VirB2 component (pilin)